MVQKDRKVGYVLKGGEVGVQGHAVGDGGGGVGGDA